MKESIKNIKQAIKDVEKKKKEDLKIKDWNGVALNNAVIMGLNIALTIIKQNKGFK